MKSSSDEIITPGDRAVLGAARSLETIGATAIGVGVGFRGQYQPFVPAAGGAWTLPRRSAVREFALPVFALTLVAAGHVTGSGSIVRSGYGMLGGAVAGALLNHSNRI